MANAPVPDGASRRAWAILAVVGTSNLQMSMALSMIFVVFPDLERSFPDSSSATLSWAVNIFTIVGASTLVLGSAIAVRYGPKRILLAGIALFTLSSIGAALAPAVGVLVAARVGQALGASLTMPSASGIVFGGFPPERRSVAVATWSAVGAIGAALGPSIGGVLIDLGSWRWAFWLNLPMGLVSFAIAALVLPATPSMSSLRLPDALSGALLFFGMATAVLGLVQSPEWGWADVRTIGAIVVGLALLAFVVRRSAHHPRPLLQLSLFRDRTFGFGNLGLFVLSVSFFGFLLTSVVFLTDVWDWSIRRAGLFTTPLFAATALTSLLAGRLGSRFGYGRVLALGGAIWAAGTVWMALAMPATPDSGLWFMAIVVAGLGSGLLWGGMFAVTLSRLPVAALPLGSGLNQTLQNLGNVLGVAVVVTVLGTTTLADRGAFPAVWFASAAATVVAAAVGMRAFAPGAPSTPAAPAARITRSPGAP
jgi:EmrB/QacA subfamily drug resistance transporter